LAKETDVVYPAQRASVYLTSKLAAEILSESFRIAGRIPVSILRVSSVYGFGMSPHGSMPLFAERIRQGEIIELQDGGRHAADFVDVADVVRGTLQVIDRGGTASLILGRGSHLYASAGSGTACVLS
jgi:nucleoside-diphosphate-sugar epimerase